MARPADPHARASLITAARKEFVRVGIQRARIEDITAACGLSKGAFYLHFESKESLFRELCKALEAKFDELTVSRDAAYGALIAASKPSRKKDVSQFVAAMAEIDAREDRHLLELLWDWRDVTDVLLRGSQGTEFDGVMWTMLDREVERVMAQCQQLERVRLVRADVPVEVVGMMLVGTYLLVARRMAKMAQKPDFDHWVRSLQTLIANGISTRSADGSAGALTPATNLFPAAKTSKTSVSRKKRTA
ncbi:MAG: TetR/AcrR family transcriptional regulator [Archangium sp.]|nr:TetR/AcrR family transcriptional regulator [Archangium sp.]